MTKLYPCADRLVVEPDPEKGEQVLDSGLILPAIHKERPTTGKVVEVGPEVGEVAPGQKILFGKYAGVDVELDRKKMTIIKQADILAIVVEEVEVSDDDN